MRDPKAKEKFLQWVANEHPAVYRAAMYGRRNLAGLGFLDVITGILGAGAKLYGDKQAKKQAAKDERAAKIAAAHETANAAKLALLQQNAARANAGYGPLDAFGKDASLSGYLPYLIAGGGVIMVLLLRGRRG